MRIKTIFSCLIFAVTPAMAQDAVDDSSQNTAPDVLIQSVAQELLDNIEAKRDTYKNNPDDLYAMVDKIVLPHFDFDLMSRLVLGRAWVQADEAQQAKFKDSFQSLLIKTYSTALLQYGDQDIAWGDARYGEKPDRAQVISRITVPGESPVEMEYRLRQRDDGWKVYDVAVDQISLVTNYRGTYASEIRRNGLDSLIAKLEDQLAQ